MIDIENELFDTLYKKIVSKYPEIFVTGEYVQAPPKFPCVSIIEVDNQMYRNSRSSTSNENHAQIVYEINVYSMGEGKKSQSKSILAIIDEEMLKLGFTRMRATPIPNLADTSIYRMNARYRAIVSRDKTIYRR